MCRFIRRFGQLKRTRYIHSVKGAGQLLEASWGERFPYTTEWPDCGRVRGSWSELERAVRNLEQRSIGSRWVPGLGFCGVGTRVCPEMWVSDSARLLGQNGAWERGL